MQSAEFRKQRSPAAVRTGSCSTLSVVIVSTGPAVVTQHAAQSLNDASRDFTTQLIVVSRNADPRFASKLEATGAEFIAAPPGSTRAEMCDLGMSCATGSIVAVRDDVAVGDARWIDTYRAVLPARTETVPSLRLEVVVMDTLVARRAAIGDTASSSMTSAPKEHAAAIEMAAAG